MKLNTLRNDLAHKLVAHTRSMKFLVWLTFRAIEQRDQ